MLYYITGPGADQDPVGRFRIDHNTGFVRVYSILDREEIAFYRVSVLSNPLYKEPLVTK